MVERNFRTRDGEIDLIAEENGVLCFVEVKGRRSIAFGSPAEAITTEKERRLIRAARAWLARSKAPARDCRFDVVCLTESPQDGRRVEIIRDAFRLPDEPGRR